MTFCMSERSAAVSSSASSPRKIIFTFITLWNVDTVRLYELFREIGTKESASKSAFRKKSR
jgi:hypothetical protein